MRYFRIFLSLFFFFSMPLMIFGNEQQPFIVNNPDEEIYALEESSEEILDETTIVIPEQEIQASELAKTAASRLPGVHIDLRQVFYGSPFIYTILLFLSMTAVMLFLYTILRWRILGSHSALIKKTLTRLLEKENRNEALLLCKNKKDLLSRMVLCALKAQGKTKGEIEEVMQREARLATSASWQRISLLNDIALIAPMLGLMGTVLGMFYAFYDLNRSLDTITKLFDGLGISVGTTVAGLLVALLSLLLHTFCKHRLMRRLVLIEQETQTFVALLTGDESD